jgi:hypothetical protein
LQGKKKRKKKRIKSKMNCNNLIENKIKRNESLDSEGYDEI